MLKPVVLIKSYIIDDISYNSYLNILMDPRY